MPSNGTGVLRCCPLGLSLLEAVTPTRTHCGRILHPNTRYTVDGYDRDTHTLYEFHGCFWHGCPTCHLRRSENHTRVLYRSMGNVYDLTTKREAEL